MTRPLAADDFSEINRRQREIAAENGLAATGEICTCPPGPLVNSSCPVHNAEFRRALEAAASACDCPANHDAQGVSYKVHVWGCPLCTPGIAARCRDRLDEATALAIGPPERGR